MVALRDLAHFQPEFYPPAITDLDGVRSIGREVRGGGFRALKTNVFTYDAQGRLVLTAQDLDGDGTDERRCARTWQDRVAEERCGDGLVQRLTHDDRWLLVRSESIRESDDSVRSRLDYTYRQDCQFESYTLAYAEPINGRTGMAGTYRYEADRIVEVLIDSTLEGGGLEPLFEEQVVHACP